MKKKWLMLVFAFAPWITGTHAQKNAVVLSDGKGWYKIGEISASFVKETESISIIGKDEFSRLKLRVEDAPIAIDRVQIFFEGGKVQEAEVKQHLQAGEETNEIKLYAENLEIDKVVFTYKTDANDKGEKAEVQLFGFKSYRDGSGGDGASATNDDLKDEAENIEENIESTVDEVKESVNEGASKADAEITDEKLDGKTGPNGQTIYIDDNKNYYWVDERGNRHYTSILDLKDKE